jgi:hypothetical protein
LATEHRIIKDQRTQEEVPLMLDQQKTLIWKQSVGTDLPENADFLPYRVGNRKSSEFVSDRRPIAYQEVIPQRGDSGYEALNSSDYCICVYGLPKKFGFAV